MHKIDCKRISKPNFSPKNQPKSKISDSHAKYFRKVRGLTAANWGFERYNIQYLVWKYWWVSGEKWEVNGACWVLLFANSVRWWVWASNL
jgi:hypothetical protein